VYKEVHAALLRSGLLQTLTDVDERSFEESLGCSVQENDPLYLAFFAQSDRAINYQLDQSYLDVNSPEILVFDFFISNNTSLAKEMLTISAGINDKNVSLMLLMAIDWLYEGKSCSYMEQKYSIFRFGVE